MLHGAIEKSRKTSLLPWLALPLVLFSIIIYIASITKVINKFTYINQIESKIFSPYLLILILLLVIVCCLLIIRKFQQRMIALEAEKEEIVSRMQRVIERHKKQISNLKNLYNNSVEYNGQKTDFFSNITHELKTPLTVILGAIQLIEHQKQYVHSERRKSNKHINTMRQNCYRMLRLVNNILDITKMDSGFVKLNLSNCNIVYLVEEITQSVAPFADQKGISLIFDTEAEEIITAVDIDKIERIILNLLSNAIKFTGTGGKIAVNIRLTDGHVVIWVKDTGVGIPKSMQNTIFERFRQVNSTLTREFEGSGIGLSLVKSFVELHNGEIRVYSEENMGSEFTIELPVRVCENSDNNALLKVKDQSKIVEAINIEFSEIYSAASKKSS